MSDVHRRWFYLILLSLIWGSSYILIKKSLIGFNPFQLGAVRIVLAAAILLLTGFRSLINVEIKEWKWIALSAFSGTFFPVFLFSFAITEIDSSITSILNSLVPLFTLFIGYFLFRFRFRKNQLIGVVIGLSGAVLLILLGASTNTDQNYWFAGFAILASFLYALNANVIKSKLQHVSPMAIAVGSFLLMLLPALGIVIASGALGSEQLRSPHFLPSLGYLFVLAVFSTCLAKVMYARLIQISDPVFSVSVTYLIPVVGILWGTLDGEVLGIGQLVASGIILLGVYLVNKKSTP